MVQSKESGGKYEKVYSFIKNAGVGAVIMLILYVIYLLGAYATEQYKSADIKGWFTELRSEPVEQHPGLTKAIERATLRAAVMWEADRAEALKFAEEEAGRVAKQLALLRAEEAAEETERAAALARVSEDVVVSEKLAKVTSIGTSEPPENAADLDCRLVTREDTVYSRKAAGVFGCTLEVIPYMPVGEAKVCDAVTYECDVVDIR